MRLVEGVILEILPNLFGLPMPSQHENNHDLKLASLHASQTQAALQKPLHQGVPLASPSSEDGPAVLLVARMHNAPSRHQTMLLSRLQALEHLEPEDYETRQKQSLQKRIFNQP